MRINLGDDCYVDPSYVVGYYRVTEYAPGGMTGFPTFKTRLELAGGRSVETSLGTLDVALLLGDEAPVDEPIIKIDADSILEHMRKFFMRERDGDPRNVQG